MNFNDTYNKNYSANSSLKLGRIVVDVGIKSLSLYKDNQLINAYPVAIGKPNTPTPLGEYKIISKVINPGGILGSRWMGLSLPNYGIHGTNNPASIGTAASLGCIRMYNHDVEAVFEQISIGTQVKAINSNLGIYDIDQANFMNTNYKDGYREYLIKQGDTMWKIAKAFSLSVDSLRKINVLAKPDYLVPGQKILLPIEDK